MLTKEEIKFKIKQNAGILKDFKINRIGLFGSYASGQYTETSDIDLLLEFSDTISLPQYVHLSDTITSFFNQPVDLVTINGIKSSIKEHVLNEVEWVEGL